MNQNSHTEANDSCLNEETEGIETSATQSTTMTAEEAFLASMLAGRDVSDLTDPVHEQQVYDDAYSLLTKEQQQHIAENKALETVFYDIRERSHEGELTTCDYWSAVDLVPEHMEPDAFTKLVLTTIEHTHDAAPFSALSSEGTADGNPSTETERFKKASSISNQVAPQIPGHSATLHPSPYKTTVVKTAKDFMEEAKRAAALKAHPEVTSSERETAYDKLNEEPVVSISDTEPSHDIDAESSAHKDAAQATISNVEQITSADATVEINPEPTNITDTDTAFTSNTDSDPIDPEVQQKLNELLAEPTWDVSDIQILKGSEPYLYSQRGMTENFAHWAFLAAEDNDVTTFVDTVRSESRLYPRPMIIDSLHNKPFYMSDERIWAAYHEAQQLEQYADILQCNASNGDVYFYSTLYLSNAQAQALAEWFSVERKANM